MAGTLLRDHRVLVVEDESIIAQAMSRGLRRAGATVLGPVADVAAALTLLDHEAQVDGAVLDINLGNQKVYPVVDALLARGTRCVFATGSDPADVPAPYASMTRCQKPVDPGCLVRALTGSAPQPVDANRHDALVALRDQLLGQIRVADRAGATVLAAKLCDALDAVEDRLGG